MHEIEATGLSIHQWTRYEIENYLLVPSAIPIGFLLVILRGFVFFEIRR